VTIWAQCDNVIEMIIFTAQTISGLGRGKSEMVPTVNLQLDDVPRELEEGIYACRAGGDSGMLPAAMHYGPRPAINAGRSCEVHFIDHEMTQTPLSLTVEIIARLRDVEDFPTVAALHAQIQADIAVARAILAG